MGFGKGECRMSSSKIGHTINTGDRVFDIINYTMLFLLAAVTLYPFWYIIVISISTQSEANKIGLHIFTSRPSWDSYGSIFDNKYIYMAYLNTIIRTVLGSSVNLALTIMLAYAMSKKYLPHRTFYTSIVVFTMFFGGGLIPSYLLVKSLNLINTMWALILPGAINTFNMIIMRNYFQALPLELEESAKMDGANDVRILISIYLPVSMPVIATVSLWYLVGHWNAWFDALIYTNGNGKLMVLQLLLRKVLIEGSDQYINSKSLMINDSSVAPSPESLKAATIMVATIPILMVYPFIQKYFVKGIMIGSLKG